jgi:hypothetical protein
MRAAPRAALLLVALVAACCARGAHGAEAPPPPRAFLRDLFTPRPTSSPGATPRPLATALAALAGPRSPPSPPPAVVGDAAPLGTSPPPARLLSKILAASAERNAGSEGA